MQNSHSSFFSRSLRGASSPTQNSYAFSAPRGFSRRVSVANKEHAAEKLHSDSSAAQPPAPDVKRQPHAHCSSSGDERLDKDLVLSQYWRSLQVNGFESSAVWRTLSRDQLVEVFELCGIDKIGHQWYIVNKYTVPLHGTMEDMSGLGSPSKALAEDVKITSAASPPLNQQTNIHSILANLASVRQSGAGRPATAAGAASSLTASVDIETSSPAQQRRVEMTNVDSHTSLPYPATDATETASPERRNVGVLRKLLFRPHGRNSPKRRSQSNNSNRRAVSQEQDTGNLHHDGNSHPVTSELLNPPEEESVRTTDDADVDDIRTVTEMRLAPSVTPSEISDVKRLALRSYGGRPSHYARTPAGPLQAVPSHETGTFIRTPFLASLHEGLAYKTLVTLLGEPHLPSGMSSSDASPQHARRSSRRRSTSPRREDPTASDWMIEAARRRFLPSRSSPPQTSDRSMLLSPYLVTTSH